MQKRFVEYTEAQELQQLGFDEICFGYYTRQGSKLGCLKDLIKIAKDRKI